jgi:hypothetical protein
MRFLKALTHDYRTTLAGLIPLVKVVVYDMLVNHRPLNWGSLIISGGVALTGFLAKDGGNLYPIMPTDATKMEQKAVGTNLLVNHQTED